MLAKLKKYFGVLCLSLSVIFCMGAPTLAVAGSHESGYMTGTGSGDGGATDTDSDSYTEFDGIWNRIVAWTEGSLGRVVAGAFVLVGIIAGVAKQSLMAFAIGISAALGLVYAPSIIKSVFSGDVQGTADAVQAAFDSFSNHAGLTQAVAALK